jgi:hypothetical protein
MSDQICKTGLWVDDSTGEVVTTPPVEGSLLVRPGAVITPTHRRAVELVGGTLDTADVTPDVETASDTPDVEAPEPDAVETADVAPKTSRAKRRS